MSSIDAPGIPRTGAHRPGIDVVLVHYHTPGLLVRAVEALRRDLDASGLEGHLVVVDNGNDEAGRARVRALGVEHLEPGTNLGYAAAINLGARRGSADVVVVMNPDVLVRPGCLGALARELRERGAWAAGPRLYLDEEERLLLPPCERRRRRDELLRRLAPRGDPWARWARRSWRRHARRHWDARAPVDSIDLSGALIALRRDALERVGPFDEQYFLYFEENDWLERLARAGGVARHVPEARAVHLWARSPAPPAQLQERFERAERRFAGRHYGAAFLRLVRRIEAPPPPEASIPPSTEPPRVALPADRPGRVRTPLWVEVAPEPRGFPAASAPIEGTRWELPRDLGAQLPPGPYRLRLVDDAGRELDGQPFLAPTS